MIFNSLGSNYDIKFAIKTLFRFGTKKSEVELNKLLSHRYGGETVLLYKGREAIKLALRLLNLPKGSKVGITGFTCLAVYQPIVELGYYPQLIDIDKDTLNFDLDSVKKQRDLKVLIVQNTLGITCDTPKIYEYCKSKGIVLIEDLAHCAGYKYGGGREVGTIGDMTVLSFGRDKAIDAVAGGALVIRNKDLLTNDKKIDYKKIDLRLQLTDRIYPILTYIIRKTYPLGLGKLIHFISKNVGLMTMPVDVGANDKDFRKINLHKLPQWYCGIVIDQLMKLDDDIKHRDQIINIYKNEIGQSSLGKLRASYLFEKRSSLLSYLERHGIHLSDIWYDSPIAPKKYLKLTNYESGDCPVSDEVSAKIVNLPTHINVSAKDALRISKLINLWKNTK